MKGRTVFKRAIGAVALVILIAVCGVVWLFVAFYMDMEKGEKHRRQFQAEQESGRWDFGEQPALFAVAQGIVKNGPQSTSLLLLLAGQTLLRRRLRVLNWWTALVAPLFIRIAFTARRSATK